MNRKRKTLNKNQRMEVYNKCNGHCAYCGCELEYKDMQVDHVKAFRHGGEDNIDNYLPACRSCNHYKRANGLEGFREMMTTIHERISNDYITKVGLRYGIVKLTPWDGIFYFEKEKNNE